MTAPPAILPPDPPAAPHAADGDGQSATDPALRPDPSGGLAGGPEPPFGACPPGIRVRAIASATADPRLPRPLRAALRRRLRRFLPRRPADVHVAGLRLRCRPGDNKVDDDILLKRRLDEPRELAFVRRALRPGDLFVDVGANIGVATLDALVNGPADVAGLALEPHPALFPRLLFHLAANGVADRVDALSVAAGAAEGEATLHASSSGNAGRSSLKPFAGDRPTTFTVPVRSLATLLAARTERPLGVLKIDVEGFEDAVLVPFLERTPVPRLPRAVVLETVHRGAWQKDCLGALAARGYIVREETAENAMLHRADASC